MSSSVIANLLPALLFVLLIHPATAGVPYTPSYVLLSPQHNESLAYLLLSGHSEESAQFLSLNISAGVDAANPQYSVLLDKTPFQSNAQSPFIPAIDDQGIIKVYTGNCHGSDQAAVWHFSPSHNSSSGNGTWDKLPVSKPPKVANKILHGPNFLAGAFTYASSNTSDSSLYTFGGMCPLKNGSSQKWVSAAKYSQSMTVLDPSGSSGDLSYHIATTGHRAPPIAEAGFTMTPLHPTYAITSAGPRMQQQDFLVIGGHTHKAFINMSELAIFSVPQNSWSYVTVRSEPRPGKSELVVRDTPTIEPRSGHSAVVTPDGTKVVIFGGWVGETSAPADPQLAVLEIGEGYGGTTPWIWKFPSTAGGGPAHGAGVYGHGATMLPGGVMMVAGGYAISQPSKRPPPRPQHNSQVYLYNVTSNSWVNSYTSPAAQAAGTSKPQAHSGSLSSGQKAGLGVGLGLGLPFTVGLAFLCWALTRKRRAHRRREDHIHKLALGAERPYFWAEDQHLANSMRRLQMQQAGGWGPELGRAYPWAGNRGYGGRPAWPDNGGDAMAERTALLVDPPSPTRNSRQSLSAKIHRFSLQHSELQRSDNTGDIHPIDEREEYEPNAAGEVSASTRRPDLQCPEFGDATDPFVDAPLLAPQSANFGAIPDNSRGSGGFASGHVMSAQDGRSSPEKNSRPSSNISDSSTLSASTKSAFQARMAIFSRPHSLPTSGRHSPEKSASLSTDSKETGQNGVDSTMTPVEKHQSADSFSTAYTTLEQRHAEGEHLLADGPEQGVPPQSPSKRPRASDWMGSVRRVFSVSQKSPAAGAESSFAPIASGIDRRSTVLGPSKRLNGSENHAKPPRRAVSASAELFRRRQGASNWAGTGKRLSRETTFRTPKSAADDIPVAVNEEEHDDWDVDGAGEDRRVQVTFTAPKERLRVVNATDEDLDGLSEKSLSRNSSRRVGRVVSG